MLKKFTNKKIHAFTLAEVLIALGIIGVIAALTLPHLIIENQKKEMLSRLQKAYTTLSQAVRTSELDNGNNSTWDWGTSGDATSVKQSFDKYWAPYIKIAKVCDTTLTDCGYSDQIKTLSGGGANGVVSPTTRTTVILNDGSLLIVWVSSKFICVDINSGKAPNVLGKDVFYFALDSNRGLVPIGYDIVLSTINLDCSTSGSGSYCAAKIMREGWQISSDYPW